LNKIACLKIEPRQVICVSWALMTKGNKMVLPFLRLRKISTVKKVDGWWRPAANDKQYRPVFRLTEFGLGD
jgi:hypothetical protein